MSFIGIITNTKNEAYMSKALIHNFQKEQIIFITDKNIENMKNIRFETVVIDTNLKHIKELQHIILNAKYILLNADIVLDLSMLKDLNLIVISYGFQNKATFTVSSVSETNIIICLQRIMKTVYKRQYDPQEFEVINSQAADIHAIISLHIILLLYEKNPYFSKLEFTKIDKK